ncbi:MAG TPA: carboxymuconolactone decarboxylase family protein [Candidatus Limnocylindria bacterium]|nr:carboxymuconolactone decarboxylase family protein [Candidatus Limnocylindria bacterium]
MTDRLRLARLERGHARPKLILIGLFELIAGVRFDDVARTSLYRPGFFGREWGRFLRGLLRGPSEWSPAERELLAAFVSRLNECPFCVGVHTATAAIGLTREVDVALLDGWRDAALDARIRAAFELLEARASGRGLQAEDVARARGAGLSRGAINDALYIGFAFDLVNRLANAFGFTTVDEAGRRKTAAILHRLGYRVPGALMR